MKVHVVFSLNVNASFADDIIRLVSSVRYRLYGKLLTENVLEFIRHRININEKIFLILSEKIIFRTKI